MATDAPRQVDADTGEHSTEPNGADVKPTAAVKNPSAVKNTAPPEGTSADDDAVPRKTRRRRSAALAVPTQGELLPGAAEASPATEERRASVISDIEPLLEAMRSRQPADATPAPTLWTVMLLGKSGRPHLTWATDLDVALAQFMRSCRNVVAAAPEAAYSMAGEDKVTAMLGLSLYKNDKLCVALQQAGAIVANVDGGSIPSLPCGSFAEAAQLVTSALANRRQLEATDVGSGASLDFRQWDRASTALAGRALEEGAIPAPMSDPDAQKLWTGLSGVRTIATYLAPDIWF